MKKYLVYFFFVLTSCETLVNTIPASELPNQESQLTLFSYISPQDTVIRVRVSQTSPLFGDVPFASRNTFVVMDGDTMFGNVDSFDKATVTISNGQVSAALLYDAENELYSLPVSQFPIKAGGTYTLTATDGKRAASASCTVPEEQVPIKKYSLDTTISVFFGRRDTTVTLSFVWDDLPGKVNYYRVNAYELIDYSVVKVDTSALHTVESRKSATSYFNWRGNNTQSIYQSDMNLDGTTFSSPNGRKSIEDLANYGQTTNSVKPSRDAESKGIYLQLSNTDVHYYKFHSSFRQQRGDTPFTEPSLVYTNVKGGLGVFAAYNQSVKVIKP